MDFPFWPFFRRFKNKCLVREAAKSSYCSGPVTKKNTFFAAKTRKTYCRCTTHSDKPCCSGNHGAETDFMVYRKPNQSSLDSILQELL